MTARIRDCQAVETMSVRTRPATAADASAVAAIYNQGIEERQATFETRPRTAEELLDDIAGRGAPPFLVADRGRAVLGWGRIAVYSKRSCYAGVGEASIYVDREARGSGVGRLLFEALCDAAAARGYWKLVGLLFPTNAASVALVRAVGCREVGVHHRHGQLDGEWRDVLLVERGLGQPA
jgi:L-amino acid N-acyltransferase YncA